jgi:hypothetical protein
VIGPVGYLWNFLNASSKTRLSNSLYLKGVHLLAKSFTSPRKATGGHRKEQILLLLGSI